MKKIAITSLLLIFALSTFWATVTDTEKLNFFTSLERSAAGLTKKQVQVGNDTVVYLDGGQGEVILMIHGFGANKDNWLRLAKHFTDNYRVIAIDLPGFGESTISETSSYDAVPQAQRLKSFLEALNIDKAHITGNSMGGYISANFASLYPEKTISTWLLNPLGVQTAAPSEMFEIIQAGGQPYVLPRNLEEFYSLLDKVFFEQPFTPDFAIRALSKDFEDHYKSNERTGHEIHNLQDNKITFTSPIEIALQNYKKPLLIIWGDNDKILSPDGLRVLAEELPTAETIMMKNMGHAPMVERPEETANTIKAFLKSKSST